VDGEPGCCWRRRRRRRRRRGRGRGPLPLLKLLLPLLGLFLLLGLLLLLFGGSRLGSRGGTAGRGRHRGRRRGRGGAEGRGGRRGRSERGRRGRGRRQRRRRERLRGRRARSAPASSSPALFLWWILLSVFLFPRRRGVFGGHRGGGRVAVRFCVQRARKARKEREKKTGDGAPPTQNNGSQTARKTFFPPVFPCPRSISSNSLSSTSLTSYPRRLPSCVLDFFSRFQVDVSRISLAGSH